MKIKRKKWATTPAGDRAFVYNGLKRVLEIVNEPGMGPERAEAVSNAIEALAETAGDKSPLSN